MGAGFPVTTGQWFSAWPRNPHEANTKFRDFLERLVASGVDETDPDVRLWWAVLMNLPKLLQEALESGANPDVRDSEIMRRYPDFL
jgi:hypothetical protein